MKYIFLAFFSLDFYNQVISLFDIKYYQEAKVIENMKPGAKLLRPGFCHLVCMYENCIEQLWASVPISKWNDGTHP